MQSLLNDPWSVYSQKMKEGISLIDKIPDPQNYVVFFDIDDTLININTFPELKMGEIVQPIYNLYSYARSKGIKIVIITARPGFSENSKRTIEELKHHKIIYELLYLRPPQNMDQDFKTFCRRDALAILKLKRKNIAKK